MHRGLGFWGFGVGVLNWVFGFGVLVDGVLGLWCEAIWGFQGLGSLFRPGKKDFA